MKLFLKVASKMRSAIKRIIFIIITLFCSLSIYSAVPKWMSELEKVYPTNEFIRSIGEGDSIKKAEQDAVSAISLNFNAKVKVINKAIKEYNSIVSEEKTQSSKSYNLKQESIIASDVEFLCVKFSEPYFDKKNKEYFVTGYINRKDASEYYEQKINEMMMHINAISGFANNEKESLYSLLNYQKAAKLAKIASYYIDTACLLNPDETNKYEADVKELAELQANLQNQRKRNSFSVDCNNNRYRTITTGISSILEDSGFVLTRNNPKYKINVDIHFTEEVYEAGNFVRPDLQITITNAEGQPVESYSEVYPRYSHQTIENAYSLALVRIQQDLEENFLSDYREE